MDIVDDLAKYADVHDRVIGSGARVWHPKRAVYLSGAPYLFSVFGERAFVFASPTDAAQFIAAHPNQLAGCEVLS